MMAADWIPMQKDLWTCPHLVRILSALQADTFGPDCPQSVRRAAVVGALFRLWSIADTHSEDGTLPGYTVEALDFECGLPGFCAAVEAAGWLTHDAEGVALPRFTEWNGQTAKRRLKDAKRKADGRRVSAKCPPGVRKVSAPDADKVRTTEQNRTEEKRVAPPYSPPPGGDNDGQSQNAPDPDQPDQPDEAFLALPDRIDRAEALAGWADLWEVWPAKTHEHNSRRRYFHALERGATPDAIIAGARALAASLDSTRFCPALYKWLAAERWTERPEPAAGGTTGTPRPLKRDRASAKRLAAREELPVVYLSTIYMPDGELLDELDFPSGKPPTNAINLEDYL